MAQRQIIILQRTVNATLQPVFGYVLRADVPVARRPFVANPDYKSAFVPIPPDVDPDLANLTNGAIVERTDVVTVEAAMSLADIQALLIRLQQAFQTEVTADKTWLRYGSWYDGAWHAQGA